MRVATAAILALLVSCSSAPAPETPKTSKTVRLVIDHVRVFDGEATRADQRVVVAGGLIEAIGDSASIALPDGAEFVDGRGKTLLPGFIDAHTHTWGRAHLAQALVYGVTTELDMLSHPKRAAVLKEKSEADASIAGLFAAGNAVTAPGGHGTQFGIDLETLAEPEEAEAFVARRVREGSDYIKLIYDDFSAWGWKGPTLSKESLGAAIRAAHAHEKKAVVHIAEAQAARTAGKLGADGLVHLWVDGADAALAERLAENEVFVVPTLSVLTSNCPAALGPELAKDPRLEPYLPAADAAVLESSYGAALDCEGMFEAVGQLDRAGVSILAGTDAPNPGTAHGISIHGELELLVRAGLSPTEALRAATSRAADAFLLDDRGRIAPGKRADLVLVEGDPTRDITASRRIAAIWRGGTRLDREAAMKSPEPRRSEAGDPAGAVKEGRVSDFEDGTTRSAFGAGWTAASDSVRGGSSEAEAIVIDGGAEGTDKALRVAGEVVGNGPVAWAGVNFVPGASFVTPADLSEKSGISFFARGDGKTYTVILFTPDNYQNPPVMSFVAGKEWEEHRFAFADFRGSDGAGVAAFFIGSVRGGSFSLDIDEVRLW